MYERTPLIRFLVGPAGTGKTESVKALGNQLGRFVLVFNCDETFDFQAMGRIFVGLCQVGAWGCFDEFNRLEERMLSAVSQQVQTIQEALKSQMEAAQEGNIGGGSKEFYGAALLMRPKLNLFRSHCGIGGETSASVPRHGDFHYDESGLRRTFELTRQFEEALQVPRHDNTGPSAHR